MLDQSNTLSLNTQPLQALRERIGRAAPWLHVIPCTKHPHSSLEVRDTSHYGIHVAFSNNADLSVYLHAVGRGGVSA